MKWAKVKLASQKKFFFKFFFLIHKSEENFEDLKYMLQGYRRRSKGARIYL